MKAASGATGKFNNQSRPPPPSPPPTKSDTIIITLSPSLSRRQSMKALIVRVCVICVASPPSSHPAPSVSPSARAGRRRGRRCSSRRRGRSCCRRSSSASSSPSRRCRGRACCAPCAAGTSPARGTTCPSRRSSSSRAAGVGRESLPMIARSELYVVPYSFLTSLHQSKKCKVQTICKFI